MASTASFKQLCPSCEAPVTIRDASQIGKKIECPKCKYRFVVLEPARERDEDEEVEEGIASKPSKKPKTAGVTAQKPAAKGKGDKAKGDKGKDEDDKSKKKKKKGDKKKNTLIIGVVLAIVAVGCLGYGGYYLATRGKKKTPVGVVSGRQGPGGTDKTGTDKGDKGDKGGDKGGPLAELDKRTPEADITNYLPANCRTIADLSVKDLLKSAARPPALGTAGAFKKESFEELFGLKLEEDLEQVVLGLNARDNTVCSVVRLGKRMDKKARDEFLARLKADPRTVGGDEFYVTDKPFDSLGNLLFKGNLPRESVAVKFIDPQTLIFADEKTMGDLMHADRYRPKPAEASGEEAAETKPAGDDKESADAGPVPATPLVAPSGSYRAVDPRLKALLDRLRQGGNRPLLVVAEDGKAAMLHTLAEFLYPKQAKAARGWLEAELAPGGLRWVGYRLDAVSTEQRKDAVALDAARAADAYALEKRLRKDLGLDVPEEDPNDPKKPSGQTGGTTGTGQGGQRTTGGTTTGGTTTGGTTTGGTKEPPSTPASPFTVTRYDTTVVVVADRKLNDAQYKELRTRGERLMVWLKGEADMAGTQSRVYQLADALKAYVDKYKHFPRGTADRKADPAAQLLGWAPDQRLSWMAELLEFLPDGASARLALKADLSWNEGDNLLIAQRAIPAFVVRKQSAAAEPAARRWWHRNRVWRLASYRTTYPTQPEQFGATFYVGVAGVGLDAAAWDPNDSNKKNLIGVFGYDRETKLADIPEDLRPQTIVLLQVAEGQKAPWLAGGGSTVRGITDDANCMKPYLIERDGEEGVLAVMADFKVRFLKKSMVKPEEFRAMCCIHQAKKIDNLDEIAPVVPRDGAAAKEEPKEPAKDPKEPAKENQPKTEPGK